MRRAIFAVMAATVVTAAMAWFGGGVAAAQTLTDPSPHIYRPPHADKGDQHLKPCPAFGAGFVHLPGSDACIKIGGAVRAEATDHGH